MGQGYRRDGIHPEMAPRSAHTRRGKSARQVTRWLDSAREICLTTGANGGAQLRYDACANRFGMSALRFFVAGAESDSIADCHVHAGSKWRIRNSTLLLIGK